MTFLVVSTVALLSVSILAFMVGLLVWLDGEGDVFLFIAIIGVLATMYSVAVLNVLTDKEKEVTKSAEIKRVYPVVSTNSVVVTNWVELK